MKSLEAQLDAWATATVARTEAVIKTTVQDMAEEMQKPQARGGLMPVDTGFLRNSGEFSTPLATWQPANEPITWAWTANYAPYMDARYGFFRLPLQRFPEFVSNALQKVKGS